MRLLVDDFFMRSAEAVVDEDGIVDHFLGDAVMAFFNVPIRREDHVQRAVRVAQEIQRFMPELNELAGDNGGLAVGIGVATGLAYAGVVGSTSCNDYTALGSTVNVASRLQGAASGGEIILEEQVYAKVRASFPDAERQVVNLKGIKEPVIAYLVRASKPPVKEAAHGAQI